MRRMKEIALLGCVFLLAGCTRNETADFNASGQQTQSQQTQSQQEQMQKAYQRKDILAAGGSFSYAINEEGMILTAGTRKDIQGAFDSVIMPDTSSWENMIYIYASTEGYTVCGVDKDKKLYGDGMYNDEGEGNLSLYSNSRQIISDGISFTILNNSGKLIPAGQKTEYTSLFGLVSDGVYIAGGNAHVAVLTADGHVSSFAGKDNTECTKVGDWQDIVDIACGYNYVIGLKADGTVVAAGDNTYGQCDISGWTDIVSVAAGSYTTIGLKADGTVVATGDNTCGQCNVSDWTDIVSVVTSGKHTLGVKKDKTAVAVGDNTYGQCDVSGWSNIRMPEGLN